MDKPISMSVKDYIIRKMAVKMMKDESLLSSVISHQFSSLHTALMTNNTVEVSGFGKFLFNKKKALKEHSSILITREVLENKLLDPSLSQTKRENVERKLERCILALDSLNQTLALHGINKDLGGMEEQPDSPKEDESIDIAGVRTEDECVQGLS